MRIFDWKKNIEAPIKHGLIITVTATRIFFALKEAANVKPTKVSLDAMYIITLGCGTCGGVLAKNYTVYKKWISE